MGAISAIDTGEATAAAGTVVAAADPGAVEGVASALADVGNEAIGDLVTNVQATWDLLGEARSAKSSEIGSFNNYMSSMSQDYIDLQTGDVNNAEGDLQIPSAIDKGGYCTPDCFDTTFGPPVIGVVKVGVSTNLVQAKDFVSAANTGDVQPGIMYYLESPAGGIGAATGPEGTLGSVGFGSVYFPGEWWEFFQ